MASKYHQISPMGLAAKNRVAVEEHGVDVKNEGKSG